MLKRFFSAIQDLNQDGLLLAYHDRSDGGLLVTLLEMAFAGRCGLDVNIAGVGDEDTGGVVQRRTGRGSAGTAQ